MYSVLQRSRGLCDRPMEGSGGETYGRHKNCFLWMVRPSTWAWRAALDGWPCWIQSPTPGTDPGLVTAGRPGRGTERGPKEVVVLMVVVVVGR